MTQVQCMSEAKELKQVMNKWGVPCSIELVPGAGMDPWALVDKYFRIHHHIASRYVPGGNLTPGLGLVKNGRHDLAPPLCNGYGGFDLIYRIICMGLANHAGRGGPIVVDGVFVPKDSARAPSWGTEWEGGYQDWKIIPGMLEFMGRADNALAEWMGRPITSQMEHSTWAPDRKIDRLNFTRDEGIALTQKWNSAKLPVHDIAQLMEDGMPFEIGATKKPPRFVIGGTIIGYPTGDHRKQLLAGFAYKKIPVPVIPLSPEIYTWFSDQLISQADLDEVEEAADTWSQAEVMRHAAETASQLAPGGFLYDEMLEIAREAIRLENDAQG